MPGFFEALQNLPEPEAKRSFHNVQGKEYEVTSRKEIWAKSKARKTYCQGWRNSDESTPSQSKYRKLVKADKGYYFEDDIHWPNEIVEGGVTWQIESE